MREISVQRTNRRQALALLTALPVAARVGAETRLTARGLSQTR